MSERTIHWHGDICHIQQYPYATFYHKADEGKPSKYIKVKMLITDQLVYYYFINRDIREWYVGVHNSYDETYTVDNLKICDYLDNKRLCYAHDTILNYVKYLRMSYLSSIAFALTPAAGYSNFDQECENRSENLEDLETDDQYEEEDEEPLSASAQYAAYNII